MNLYYRQKPVQTDYKIDGRDSEATERRSE